MAKILCSIAVEKYKAGKIKAVNVPWMVKADLFCFGLMLLQLIRPLLRLKTGVIYFETFDDEGQYVVPPY